MYDTRRRLFVGTRLSRVITFRTTQSGAKRMDVESALDSILVKQVSDFWVNGRYQAISLIVAYHLLGVA